MAGKIVPRSLGNGIYGCPQTGCTYKHEEVGAVRLHYYQQHTEQGQARKKKKAPGCQHKNYRLLNISDPIEARAIEMGYTKICTAPGCDWMEK